MSDCGMYWASHACDLPGGHDGDHACLECGTSFPAVTVPDDARNINPTDLRVWPVDYSLPG